MKKKNKSYYVKKLDALWKTVGKENVVCEICATLPVNERVNYTQLQGHHIIGRSHHATRWDLQNRLWVCSRHHTFGLWDETVQDNLGGWFLNWDSNNDWMGKHRPEDKEHLRKLHHDARNFTLAELEDLINDFTN